MHMGEWASAYPSARVHAPADLAKERPDLRISRTHGEDSHPDIAGFVDELRIDGFRLQESVLLYRPARTLLVADLVHNVGRPRGAWSKFYTKGMGFYDRVALSRMLRWTAFSDPAAARRSIDRLSALPFERLIVGHGAPVQTGAKEGIANAFRWLPPART